MADAGDDPGGPAPWRVAAGLGVVALLALGLALVERRTSETSPPPASTVGGVWAAVETPGPVSSQGPGTSWVASEHDDLFHDVQSALDAWGEFGVTGDIATVAATFDPDGNQYALLVTETGSIEPTGGPPLRIAMEDPRAVTVDETVAVVEGTVTVGEGDSRSPVWRIEMRRAGPDDRWRLWTVVAVP